MKILLKKTRTQLEIQSERLGVNVEDFKRTLIEQIYLYKNIEEITEKYDLPIIFLLNFKSEIEED